MKTISNISTLKNITFSSLIMIFSLLAVFGSPATDANAASCSGNGCHGKDPSSQGCTGSAYTVVSKTKSGGGSPSTTIQVNLRYSSACVANWSQTISYSGTRFLRADVWQSGIMFNTAHSTTVYTDMLDGNVYHCATGYGSWAGGGYPYEVVTSNACG